MTKILTGIPASKGGVRGVARVILNEANFAKFKPGEILIVRQTSLAWTPLLAVAGGVVTEIGGALSHAAIVAREYGIPAVVGVKGATKMIGDGQQVEVRGEEGKVILNKYRQRLRQRDFDEVEKMMDFLPTFDSEEVERDIANAVKAVRHDA